MLKHKINKTVISSVSSFLNEISDKIKEKNVIVGFSGGADSSALLTVLNLLKEKYLFSLSAIHVNHMIRGEEAERDERFCVGFCEKISCHLKVVREDVPLFAKSHKLSLEEAAREIRYRAFSDEGEDSIIALAHNCDDNAETVLFNLARGANSTTVSGIPPVRGNIIRPLLSVTKSDIIDFCRLNDIDFVTDSTNEADDASRNVIRHSVIPALDSIFSGSVGRIYKTSRLAREDNEYLTGLALSAKIPDAGLPRSLAVRRAEHELKKILPGSLSSGHTDAVISLITDKEKLININNCYYIICDNTIARVGENTGYDFIISGDDISLLLPFAEYKIGRYQTENDLPQSDYIYCFSLSEKSLSSCRIRTRREGERVFHGSVSKEVKKLISHSNKTYLPGVLYPVISNENEIICIPGISVNEKYKGDNKYYFAINERVTDVR